MKKFAAKNIIIIISFILTAIFIFTFFCHRQYGNYKLRKHRFLILMGRVSPMSKI